MLVPGDPGSLGAHIYVFTIESQQPVGGKEHFIYAVTAETPRSGQARHTHLSSYRGNLKNVYAYIYYTVVF
jgi:hypothetical protein